MLSIPPAFNLSQDQTLQFKFDSCLWQPIFLTRDSRNRINYFLNALCRSFGYPKSTEHPHKLPNLIVKELPGYFLPRKTAYFTEPSACVKIFLNFFQAGEPAQSVRERVFYSPFSHCQQLFRTVFSVSQSFRKSPSGRSKEWRIIRRSILSST